MVFALIAGFSVPSWAQQSWDQQAGSQQQSWSNQAGGQQVTVQQNTENAFPPTVTGIHVDKTAKNAVVAREQAIIEAQKTAFEILAEKSMSPEAFKTYQVPDDATIESLVRGFQISNEQMSSNRYVADFTVRFTSQISNYITLPQGLGVVNVSPDAATGATAVTGTGASPPQTASTSAEGTAMNMPDTTSSLTGVAPAQPASAQPASGQPVENTAARRNILVLPYLAQADGTRILWDDPNPWRDAWQDAGTTRPEPNLTVTVPLGDLTDVSSGDPGAVWKGDYRTIEELRANYNATAVAVLLAHMSPAASGIDVYLYKDGVFTRLQTVRGTFDNAETFKQAVPLVIAALENPQPYGTSPTASSSMPMTPLATPVSVVNEPAPAAMSMSIHAMMNFGNFTQWMQAQRRLASVVPPLSIEISSITTHAVQFKISFNGSLNSLRTALAGKGLEIEQPVVNVGQSASASPAQETVYQLKLANAAPASGVPATAPVSMTPIKVAPSAPSAPSVPPAAVPANATAAQ